MQLVVRHPCEDAGDPVSEDVAFLRIFLMCILRHIKFSCRLDSTQPSLAAAVAECQASSGSAALMISESVGVLAIMPGTGRASACCARADTTGVPSGEAPTRHISTNASSVFSSSLSGVPSPLEASSSMSSARFSSWLRTTSCSRVRRPRASTMDSRERAICDGLGGAALAGSSWCCSCCWDFLNITLHAMFSRRAASTASAMSVAFRARRVETFQLLSTLLYAPTSWRKPMMEGPWPGMDMSQRKSL
mmetsp:Transcript_41065/g.95132  ORF Transcript_41065/g.95132 Transcript_41065/m.95132 type:complete len:248 (-) Transcript_41065:217-960(-)